ncbi:hypothetical protein COSO111634_05045 [Corallococcus soli]
MIGAPEKLRKRLLRFIETGGNWDDAKSFLPAGVPSNTMHPLSWPAPGPGLMSQPRVASGTRG